MLGAPSSGRPREKQEKFKGQDRVGIVEGSSGYRARGVKVQVRDSERCGNCCPFAPWGSVPGETFSSLRVYMGTGDLCRVPPTAARHRRARQSSGTGPNGIVEGYCGYRARGVSIREKIVLLRNLGCKTRGVAMWLNVVLTPG